MSLHDIFINLINFLTGALKHNDDSNLTLISDVDQDT